jgi:hypothetical protein
MTTELTITDLKVAAVSGRAKTATQLRRTTGLICDELESGLD